MHKTGPLQQIVLMLPLHVCNVCTHSRKPRLSPESANELTFAAGAVSQFLRVETHNL